MNKYSVMKIFLYTFVFLHFFLFCGKAFSRSFEIEINGNIEGLKDGTEVHLIRVKEIRYVDLTLMPVKSIFLDTIKSVKSICEKFGIKVEQKHSGQFYYLSIESKSDPLVLFLDQSKVNLNGSILNWPDVSVDGSSSNVEFQAFENFKKDIRNKYWALLLQANSLYKATDSLLKDSLYEEINLLSSVFVNVIKRYLFDNPSTLLTAFLVCQASIYEIDLKERSNVYNNLSSKVQQSKYGIELKDQIEAFSNSVFSEIGSRAPDFSMPTLYGDSLSMKQVVSNAKLTLIDFWASWCKYCRYEFLQLKELYAYYHKLGFDVVGVSLDYKLELWRGAVVTDNLPWHQVSDLRGFSSFICKLYNILSLPQNVLINEDGVIIAKSIKGDALKRMLFEKFKSK